MFSARAVVRTQEPHVLSLKLRDTPPY